MSINLIKRFIRLADDESWANEFFDEIKRINKMNEINDVITQTEYWTEINSIAADLVQEAMQENDNDRDHAGEQIQDYMLHETIDGHQWVIYNYYNQFVIQHSDNEDYIAFNFGGDYMADVVKDRGFSGLCNVVAYWCMYADVQDRLEQAFDEFESNLEGDE